MDIKELNNECFSKCERLYEAGYLYIENNVYKFRTFLTNNIFEIKEEDLKYFIDHTTNKKFLKIFLKSNVKRIAKRKIKPAIYNYIIVSSENMTLNNQPLDYNSILIFMENKIRKYSSLSPLFAMECKPLQRFNKQKAKEEFSHGNRSNDIFKNQTVEGENKFAVNTGSESDKIDALEKEFAVTSFDYIDDKDTNNSNDEYQIICKLFKETSSGGTVLYGYRLLDSENSKRDENVTSVMQLASKHKIKNVKVVVKNGKRILQGINFKLDELPMEFI